MNHTRKLAIVSTHPIQYNAPIFKLLTERRAIQIKVFYTWEKSKEKVYDPGFGKVIQWDIPLLEGYEYSFVENKRSQSERKTFWSIRNPNLIKEVEDWGATAILVYGWNFYSHLQAMNYFKNKIPVYFRGDSTVLNNKKGIKANLRKIALSWIYKNVDFAFYVGEQNKRYFLAHGMKASQLLFAPHAIENDRFRDDERKAYTKRARVKLKDLGVNIPEGSVTFLFAGKFEPVKNPFLLLKAFVSRKNKAEHLLMVGNGILEKEIKKAYSKYENIHFIDFQNQQEMPVIYRMADVLILPSVSETWGLAVNEAMACNKAVLVSSRVGCAVDLVSVGKNGYVFEHADINDLKNKLDCFADIMVCKKMGMEGQKMIESYSFEKICEVIERETGKLVQ